MLTTGNKKLRTFTGIACATALLTTTYFSLAQAYPMGAEKDSQTRSEEIRDFAKSRLDKLANRLEIKVSQQAAWDEYAGTVAAMAEQGVQRPDDKADATAIARYRAEKTAEMSRKLSKIADATAKLQAVLTEEQAKMFNQVSRHPKHGAWGHGGWHHGAKSCQSKHDDADDSKS